jgi:hypothetical protein
MPSREVDAFGEAAKRALKPESGRAPAKRGGRMSEGTLKRKRDEEG